MLVNIGSSKEPSDIVDMFLACHERIRSFVGVARRIAVTEEASEDEIREAAARVIRYFSEAFRSTWSTRKKAFCPGFMEKHPPDSALEAMRREHRTRAPATRTAAALQNLEGAPERLAETKESLAHIAADLEGDFLAHLQEEERCGSHAGQIPWNLLEQAAEVLTSEAEDQRAQDGNRGSREADRSWEGDGRATGRT